MKFKQYVEKLVGILEKNPNYANLEAIYASDSEGNSYEKIGNFNDLLTGNFEDYEFIGEDDVRELNEEADITGVESIQINAIVINWGNNYVNYIGT